MTIADKVFKSAPPSLQMGEHIWSHYLDALTSMPLTPIEEETSDPFTSLSPIFEDIDDEMEVLKTAASTREAVDRLGTKNRSERSTQRKWDQIYLNTPEQVHNIWENREIQMLKISSSSKEAVELIGTTRHSKRSIQWKWSQVNPKAAKKHKADHPACLEGDSADLLTTPTPTSTSLTGRARSSAQSEHAKNKWHESEIDMLKKAPSVREAVQQLGTTRHSKSSIQWKWSQVNSPTKRTNPPTHAKKAIKRSVASSNKRIKWSEDEINILKASPSSKDAMKQLKIKNHSKWSIQKKWLEIYHKTHPKQLRSTWESREISVLKASLSVKEATAKLGTKEHSKNAIRIKWNRINHHFAKR